MWVPLVVVCVIPEKEKAAQPQLQVAAARGGGAPGKPELPLRRAHGGGARNGSSVRVPRGKAFPETATAVGAYWAPCRSIFPGIP